MPGDHYVAGDGWPVVAGHQLKVTVVPATAVVGPVRVTATSAWVVIVVVAVSVLFPGLGSGWPTRPSRCW